MKQQTLKSLLNIGVSVSAVLVVISVILAILNDSNLFLRFLWPGFLGIETLFCGIRDIVNENRKKLGYLVTIASVCFLLIYIIYAVLKVVAS